MIHRIILAFLRYRFRVHVKVWKFVNKENTAGKKVLIKINKP